MLPAAGQGTPALLVGWGLYFLLKPSPFLSAYRSINRRKRSHSMFVLRGSQRRRAGVSARLANGEDLSFKEDVFSSGGETHRMMYLASIRAGLPFTNLAWTSTVDRVPSSSTM